ncbi:MAG: hypothetical protein JWQ00_303 [Noviherbaspirillum sp.]|nr:hypothetical protein [Noviherbaspirillum sp.]
MPQPLDPVSTSPSSLPTRETDVSKVPDYIPKEWLTDKQNDAYASGDPETIRRADEEAIEEAIAQSRASLVHDKISAFTRDNGSQLLNEDQLARLQDSPGRIRKATTQRNDATQKAETNAIASSNYADLLNKTRELNGKLKQWFAANGCQVVPNGGHNNNCLIISLLQLATGELSEHADKAAEVKKWLVETYPDEAMSDKHELHANTTAIQELIRMINREFRSDMRVTFVAANENGHPVRTAVVGDGKNDVVIFDQAGHFEAVVSALP